MYCLKIIFIQIHLIYHDFLNYNYYYIKINVKINYFSLSDMVSFIKIKYLMISLVNNLINLYIIINNYNSNYFDYYLLDQIYFNFLFNLYVLINYKRSNQFKYFIHLDYLI